MHEIMWSCNKPDTLRELIVEFRRPHFKKILDRLASFQVKASLGNDLEGRHHIHFETTGMEGDLDFFFYGKKELVLSQFVSDVLASTIFGKFPAQWRSSYDPHELVRFQKRKGIDEKEHDGFYDMDFEVSEVICHAFWEVCKQKKISYLSDCVGGLMSNLDDLRLASRNQAKKAAEGEIVKVVERYLLDGTLSPEDVHRCCDEALTKSVIIS